jgi:zinc and cadmium transporter
MIVSTLSLIGLVTLSLRTATLKILLIFFIAFSAGALFGDAFIHLLPELIKEGTFTAATPLLICAGIVIFFCLEKFVHWQHCHMPITTDHVHSFGIMNLIGDGLHNLLDGLIIGASYRASIPAGMATTIAIMLHEIPQEIGDLGVLLYSGFSRGKALLLNFLTALTAVVGALIALFISASAERLTSVLLPLGIGGFIYIAGSDLIPELHKEYGLRNAALQVGCFVLGIVVMLLLLLVG